MATDAWKVNLGIFAALLSLFVVVYAFGQTLTPFVIAALFAYVLNPAVGSLVEKKVPRTVAVGIFMLAFFVITGGAVAFAVYILNLEIQQLIANIPGYVDTFEAKYLPVISRYLGLSRSVDVKSFASEFMDRVTEVSPESYKSAGMYALQLLSGTVGLFLTIFNLLLIPVVMIYLMLDFDRMSDSIMDSLPKRHRKLIVARLKEVEDVLKVFVKGQLIVSILMGILYSIGLMAIGVDMPVLVGMGAGLLNLVPYLGGAVGIITAGVLAVLKYHDILHIALVAGLFGFVQMVEGYLLTPRIVGTKLGLHPVVILLALVVFGQIMGFVGVLLAVPIAAVLKVFIVGFVKDYKNSAAYAGKG